jgi:CDP-diacylglycerol---serine O-phosphatidyltransferase
MPKPKPNVTDSPEHFSMLRSFHLADFLTLGNVACGVAAIFLVMMFVGSASVAHFLAAAALVLAALVFDVFDGRVARWRHTHSALRREFDSLADIICAVAYRLLLAKSE